MNGVRVFYVALLAASLLLGSACQMNVLSKPCFQEKGCEHHPINR